MEFTISRDKAKSLLQRELGYVRRFERNIENLLTQMRGASPFGDITETAKGIQTNLHLANTHLERANIVFEMLGIENEDGIKDGDELEEDIGKIDRLHTLLEQASALK